MKFLTTIILILSAAVLLLAQKTPDKPVEQLPMKVDPVSSALIPGEWTSLPFAGAVVKVTAGKSVVIDGIKVRTKHHTLTKEQIVSAELCSYLDGSGKLFPVMDDWKLFGVKDFTTYEIRGRIFAYEVSFDFINAADGVRIGATRSEFYIDREGTGRFSIDCELKDFKLTTVPGWIKAKP